jgi:raffinose/stachyose/melibiose transport system permease protein
MTTTPALKAAPPVAAAPKGARTPEPKARIDRTYLLMLVPAVALFTFFIVLPAAIGIFFSTTNYAGYGSWDFIGLSNYTAMLDDPAILQSYGFTFLLAIVTVIVVNVLALAIAVGLNAKIKWRTGIRTVFFIPMVLSGLIVAYVFNYLLSNTVPRLAESWGLTGFTSSILVNEELAWLAIVGVTAWQSIPGATIIYLAGLQAIPGDVYEAADLDGAGSWRSFRSITFPLIIGYVVINIILGFKGYLGAYEIIVALTGGGPGTATQSVAMRIVGGFTGGDYAYQMANAVVFFIITVVISLIQLRILQRKEVSL